MHPPHLFVSLHGRTAISTCFENTVTTPFALFFALSVTGPAGPVRPNFFFSFLLFYFPSSLPPLSPFFSSSPYVYAQVFDRLSESF
jgi:hypothetical protein